MKGLSLREKGNEVVNLVNSYAQLVNDVCRAMAFADTQLMDAENNKETLLHNLGKIYKRTRKISKKNSATDTGPNFENHLKEIMVNFSSNEVNILINGIDSMPFSILEDHKNLSFIGYCKNCS